MARETRAPKPTNGVRAPPGDRQTKPGLREIARTGAISR
jgi:hypothetical protein